MLQFTYIYMAIATYYTYKCHNNLPPSHPLFFPGVGTHTRAIHMIRYVVPFESFSLLCVCDFYQVISKQNVGMSHLSFPHGSFPAWLEKMKGDAFVHVDSCVAQTFTLIASKIIVQTGCIHYTVYTYICITYICMFIHCFSTLRDAGCVVAILNSSVSWGALVPFFRSAFILYK